MNVLIIDFASVLDEAQLEILSQRGYFVRCVPTTEEALELIERTSFDCIVVEIPRSAGAVQVELAQIRQFVRHSAVALVMAGSAESIVDEARAVGSIELRTTRHLASNAGEFSQPTLVVASHVDLASIRAIRKEGIVAVPASTLTFAMNLLVDGWCQIVFLEANVPGLTGEGVVAIFHKIDASLVAVLASALSTTPSGIAFRPTPQTVNDYIKLFEDTAADNQLSYCGLARTGT